MAIASLVELLASARRGGYALGYFEAWDQYSLEAVVETAEENESPLILGFGAAVVSQSWLDHRGLDELATLARCLAERARVPTVLLFNEAQSLTQVLRSLRAGCNAVMLDTAGLPFEANIALTRQVVDIAHALGASVEAELGHLPDASDPIVMGSCTDPAQAAVFVSQTGVDALAVSVGNTHVLIGSEAAVDLDLLAAIHRAVPVPLVIHGGSGFPRAAIRPAIARGVAKFNVGTRLKHAFLMGVRAALADLPEHPNIHRIIGSREHDDLMVQGKMRVKAQIAALMEDYGSAGRAKVDQPPTGVLECGNL